MNDQQLPSGKPLTTESRNPASAKIDQCGAVEIVQLMNREDAKIAGAIEKEAEAIAAAMEAIAERLGRGGRLIYMGAGTSGRLGVLDASECPPTFNTPPEMVVGLIAGGPTALTKAIEGAEDHPEQGRADLESIGLTADDAVVGIATSGSTPYVVGGLQYAVEVGALPIGFACNESNALSQHAQLMITPIVGPEVISGSTRLKAGTATKLVLNMLTTGAMVLLGKTYGNLMVDLRASNVKLLARSKRIVADLTDLSLEAASELLEACNGEVKTAIVAHVRQLNADDARSRLASVKGHLRAALNEENVESQQ